MLGKKDSKPKTIIDTKYIRIIENEDCTVTFLLKKCGDDKDCKKCQDELVLVLAANQGIKLEREPEDKD